jgi:hypothetical protein
MARLSLNIHGSMVAVRIQDWFRLKMPTPSGSGTGRSLMRGEKPPTAQPLSGIGASSRSRASAVQYVVDSEYDVVAKVRTCAWRFGNSFPDDSTSKSHG